MASGEMDPSEFTDFLRRVFRNMATFSVNGSLHYICMDWRHLQELLSAGREAYAELKNVCVWIKDKGEWARSIAASTNSSLCSNTAAMDIATMSSLANSAATAATSGITPELTPLPAAARRAICWRCTRP